jgi:hypothetical protein
VLTFSICVCIWLDIIGYLAIQYGLFLLACLLCYVYNTVVEKNIHIKVPHTFFYEVVWERHDDFVVVHEGR